MHTLRTHIQNLKKSMWFEGVFSLLAIVSVGLFIYEISNELPVDTIRTLHRIDLAIVVLFIIDFVVGMIVSENDKQYFKSHWMDLLASIPVSGGIFQSLRLLRLFRIGRIVGSIHRSHKRNKDATTNTKRFIYLTVFALSAVFIGATGFFLAEYGVNPEVEKFFDAIWWSSLTATTVGYGDIYPLTDIGKVVGIAVMFSGVVLFGSIAGFIGSIFARQAQ